MNALQSRCVITLHQGVSQIWCTHCQLSPESRLLSINPGVIEKRRFLVKYVNKYINLYSIMRIAIPWECQHLLTTTAVTQSDEVI
jgi:hypothetical protein